MLLVNFTSTNLFYSLLGLFTISIIIVLYCIFKEQKTDHIRIIEVFGKNHFKYDFTKITKTHHIFIASDVPLKILILDRYALLKYRQGKDNYNCKIVEMIYNTDSGLHISSFTIDNRSPGYIVLENSKKIDAAVEIVFTCIGENEISN